MGRLLSLALGAGAVLLPAAADAVTVIKTYRIDSTFAADAPITRAIQTVTLTFDPAAASTAFTTLAYSGYTVGYEVGSAGAGKTGLALAFNPTDGISAYERLNNGNVLVTLYGITGSYGVSSSVPDFATSLYTDKAGALVATVAPSTTYSFGGLIYRSTSVAVAEAVPEPATWALMIAGFAMLAGSLRARRRAPAIA